MITSINQTDPPITPGVTINTHGYKLKHFRLQKMLKTAGLMAIALLECDSNNASGEVSARDSRNFNTAIAQIQREWDWAKKHRDAPNGQHELVFTVGFPTPEELSAMKNTKLQSVAMEIYNLFMVTLGSQSADMQLWVGDGSQEDVDAALLICKEITLELIGDGNVGADGEANTGVPAANFSFVGQLSPTLDGGVSPTIQEPSKTATPSNVPDAADTQ